MTDIDTAYDGLETAILLALGAKGGYRREKEKKLFRKGDWTLTALNMDAFCPAKPEFPQDMIAFDGNSEDRLYTDSMEGVVVDPVKAIGRGLEVAFLCEDGSLKWTKIKPMPPPRGLVAATNRVVSWYAMHYRRIKEGEKQEYIRQPLALTDGRVATLKPLGRWEGINWVKERQNTEEQLALFLSVFEDAQRAGCVLATVQEHARISFPVGGDAYKSFFALRDGLKDTPMGRRNPILHWCSEHIRKTPRGETMVIGHDRGTTEIVHGNMRLSLTRSEGYAPFMAAVA